MNRSRATLGTTLVVAVFGTACLAAPGELPPFEEGDGSVPIISNDDGAPVQVADAGESVADVGRDRGGEEDVLTPDLGNFPDVEPEPLEWKSVSLGNRFACGITTEGLLYCWGSNASGQLGTNAVAVRSDATSNVPIRSGNTDLRWKSVSAGFDHACAITTDEAVYCWGNNALGAVHNTQPRAAIVTPVKYYAEDASRVAAGSGHTCVLGTDEIAFCWGNNSDGQAGGASVGDIAPVVPIDTTEGSLAISVGDRISCVIDRNSEIWCWGGTIAENYIHASDEEPCVEPACNEVIVVPHISGAGQQPFDSFSVGDDHICGVSSASTDCWGSNVYAATGLAIGKIGDSQNVERLRSPLSVVGLGRSEMTSAGAAHSCAIGNIEGDGGEDVLWCWGSNVDGALGVTTVEEDAWTYRGQPVHSRWRFVDVGDLSTCGIRIDDSLWCWGRNEFGQLGLGDDNRRKIPYEVKVR